MNISKRAQPALHVLAQGGAINAERLGPKITSVLCVTRDGLILDDFPLDLFRRLRQCRFIESQGSSPYRISRAGRLALRAQPDNAEGKDPT